MKLLFTVFAFAALAASSEAQRGGRGGRTGGRGGRGGRGGNKGDRLAAINEACPLEAALCGIPVALPETPDLSALRESFQCLKEVDITTVDDTCAEVLDKIQNGRGRKNKGGKLTAIIEACPVEAAECGVPLSVDNERPDFTALRDSFQCLKEVDVATVNDACAEVMEKLQGGRQKPVSDTADGADADGGK